MTRKIADVLKEGIKSLKDISQTPQLDAEILLSEVLNVKRSVLFFNKNDEILENDLKKYDEFLKKRLAHEPVAYILKKKEFYKDTFHVDPRVLVPRPETEILVEKAIQTIKGFTDPQVLDICCGSGCIGLSIKGSANCDLVLSDISQPALEVARINSESLFGKNAEIKIIQSDLFENITGKFDILTANPPYLSKKDMEVFCVNELEHEPSNALFSGENGFEITEKIIKDCSKHLNGNGVLMLELGYEGSRFLKDTQDLKLESVTKDLSGIDRVAVFRKLT